MQPPYRSFALLELPFTFTPTVERAPLKEQTSKCQKTESLLRTHIANFYDPVQLKECFQDKNCTESPSFLHHHHHKHNRNSVNETENESSLMSKKENSEETNYNYNNSLDKTKLSSNNNYYTNSKRSREELESREGKITELKNERTKDSEELYLAIGDSNEYWLENMYSGWCRAQDWSKTPATTKEKEEDLKEGSENAQKHKNENVFRCTSPQMLVHGFYRNDLLIRVHEVKRIHRVRDCITGEVIREWEEEVDNVKREENKNLKSVNSDSENNESVSDVSEPRVEIIGVVSREMQLARPADFVFSLEEHSTSTTQNNANYYSESNEVNNLQYNSDIFPPARFLGERTPYEVRYEMGRNVNYTVAEHVARLQDMAVSTSTNKNSSSTSELKVINKKENSGDETPLWIAPPEEVNNINDREFADFRQRVESGFVDTLMVSAHNTNLPPSELLPVQVDFLSQHECQINKKYIQQKQVNTAKDSFSKNYKVVQRAIISVTGSLPELIILNKLLQQRPLWIAGMLSEAMLYSGVCPRANFNKQLVNCVTYVIATGAFNRLRVRMNMNPFVNIRSVIYQRLMIRLLRRSEQGTLLRDASRSPYLTSASAIILQRHKARIDSYRSSIYNNIKYEEVAEEENKYSNNNDICRHYPLTLIEVMCNVIKRGSLYITLQLIDILDDVLIATMVWNHIAPTLEREARLKAKKKIDATINKGLLKSTLDLQEVKSEKERESCAIVYTQRDVAQENVHLLWSELQQNESNTLEREKESDLEYEEEIVNMELPVDERDNPYGWLGQNQYTRITTRFSQALHSFLLDEVMPLLRFFAGSTDTKPVQEQKQLLQPLEQKEHGQEKSRNNRPYKSTDSIEDTINPSDNGSISASSNSRDVNDSANEDSSSMNASAPSSREESDHDSSDQDESIDDSGDSRISSDNDEQEEKEDDTE